MNPDPGTTLPVRLAALVRRHRIDVVHVHTEHANFWLALAARAAGARVVRTVHAQFDFHGALRTERRVQRRILRSVGVSTVAVSSTVADHEQRLFGNPSTVIHNWIDPEIFRPSDDRSRTAARAALALPPEALVVISVGNCHPVKRHDLILDIVERVPNSIFLHVGEEDPTGADRGRARASGITNRVRFVGAIADVRPYLLAADVLIAASDREGSSISTSEALACGLPCLLRDIPVFREIGEATAARFFASTERAAAILQSLDQGALSRWRAESEVRANAVREMRAPRRGVAAYAALYRDGR